MSEKAYHSDMPQCRNVLKMLKLNWTKPRNVFALSRKIVIASKLDEQSKERMKECVNLSRENQSFVESAEAVRASLCATEQELREARSAYTPQRFSEGENVPHNCPADGNSYKAAHVDGVYDILLRWIESTLAKEPSFMPLGEEREEFQELMCTLKSDLSHDVKSAMKNWRKDENERRSSYLSDQREGELSEDQYPEACPPTDFNTALRHVFWTLREIGKLYLEVYGKTEWLVVYREAPKFGEAQLVSVPSGARGRSTGVRDVSTVSEADQCLRPGFSGVSDCSSEMVDSIQETRQSLETLTDMVQRFVIGSQVGHTSSIRS